MNVTVGGKVNKVQVSRQLLDEAAKVLGIELQSDWFSMTRTQVKRVIGSSLFRKQASLYHLLQSTYSEFDWNPLSFRSVPKNFWRKEINHRKVFDSIAYEFGIETQQDWYGIKGDDVKAFGAEGLLNDYYNGSFVNALVSIYPEFTWSLFEFQYHSKQTKEMLKKQKELLKETKKKRLKGRDLSTQRKAMDVIAQRLGIEVQEDWYHVQPSDIKTLGAESIIYYHNPSFEAALRRIYPEFQWESRFLFQTTQEPKTISPEIQSQMRRKMDWIAEQLQIKKHEDWYSVKVSDVKRHAGDNILQSGSLVKTLAIIYPEFEWMGSLFTNAPKHHWDSPQNQREFMDWIGEQLGVDVQEDWYSVSGESVKNLGAEGLLNDYHNGSLFQTLRTVYPEYEWNPHFFEYSPQSYIKSYMDKDSVKASLQHLLGPYQFDL